MTLVPSLPRFFLLLICSFLLTVTGRAQETAAIESVIDSLAFSSHGKLLAVGVHKQQGQQILAQELRLYDVATGKLRWTATGKAQAPALVALSPDETRVVLAGQARPDTAGQATVWEVATRRPVMDLTLDKQEQLTSLAFSPDGSNLILGTKQVTGQEQNGAVKAFDVARGELQQTLLALEATPHALAYSGDGATLVGVLALAHHLSEEGTEVVFWNTADYSIKRRISLGDVTIHQIAFTPDLKKAAMMTNKLNTTEAALVLWDIETQNFARTSFPAGERISSLHFTPDGKQLIVTGSLPGKKRAQIRVLATDKGELVRELDLGKITGDALTAPLPIALHPGGQTFAVAVESDIVELRNLQSGALIRFFE